MLMRKKAVVRIGNEKGTISAVLYVSRDEICAFFYRNGKNGYNFAHLEEDKARTDVV